MKWRKMLLLTVIILPTTLVGSFGAFMIAFVGYTVENGLRVEFPRALTFLGLLTEAVILLSAYIFIMHYRSFRRFESALERERDFSAMVAHQLRRGYTALNWTLDTALDDATGAVARSKALADMRMVVGRGVRTVHALLRVSRLERGAVSMMNENVAASAIVEDALIPLRDFARQNRTTINVSVAADCNFRADRDLVAEALRNILENAIIHGEEGDIDISCIPGTDGKTMTLSIRDHGPGIPVEALEQVFKKSIASQVQSEGAGIGLYITKTLVELMDGTVDFKSTPEGSTFLLTFPAAS